MSLPWDVTPETVGEAVATSSVSPDVSVKRKKGERHVQVFGA